MSVECLMPMVMMNRGETFAASFGFGALMHVMSFIGGLLVIALIFLGGHGVNLACAAAAGFLIIGAQHVLSNCAAASYGTGIRASGVGVELGVGRVGAIPGPVVAGLLAACIALPGSGRALVPEGGRMIQEAGHA